MTTLLFLFWLILPAISSEPTLCSPVDPTVPFMSGNLMMTDDAGTNWRNMSSELPATARPWSFTANEGQYYLGASDGIYAGSSMICGTEWEKIYFPQKDISGLYPGKKGPYASSPWSGFYQYQPATGLWRSMHEQLEDKNVYTVVETENGDIFAGCETGLYKTNNRGKSWKK